MKINENKINILPIADTVSGVKARQNPNETLEHYKFLSKLLWLPPKVKNTADDILSRVSQGNTTWGSISGPYGFGKTANAIALWDYAQRQGYVVIPPLSCTSFDELAYGIAILTEVLVPKAKKQIRTLFKEIWKEELKQIAQVDAKRYTMSVDQMKRILEDKLNDGKLTIDSHCHRLVEFLSKLSKLVLDYSKGLIIILDELQQLLGPLDVRAIVRFREFVWGMRTERSHCGIVLIFDSLLEARLERWAADVLHRIRENGPSLQLSNIYSQDFPFWLWKNITKNYSSQINALSITEDVLDSLGQFVQRSDIANGPRTVVDVFSKAINFYIETGMSYDIPQFVQDIYKGQFRYFGENALIQRILSQLLSDEWIIKDEARKMLVSILAVYPLGCPQTVINRFIPDNLKFQKVKSEIFGSLLVELSNGLALEQIQHVRRPSANWEQMLSRCWETLPGLDALAAHLPDIILRILLPRIFPKGNPSNPTWERISDDSRDLLSGWQIYRGSFDDSYPSREVAVSVSNSGPKTWLDDVDVCIAFVCNSEIQEPIAQLIEGRKNCIILGMPILKSLDLYVPAELERYKKFIQPEPFRPATILTAMYELEIFLGTVLGQSNEIISQQENEVWVRRAQALIEISLDFVVREMLQGTVDVGNNRLINLRGIELIRALFTKSVRLQFSEYSTIIKTFKWRENLEKYRNALRNNILNKEQRLGKQDIVMPKSELYETLFEQTSTAAGDSFIRSLGPLVKTSGTPQSFAVRLLLHPSEAALLKFLRGLKKEESYPKDVVIQFLRHKGYIEDEAIEIIKILVDRELILYVNEREVQVVRDNNAVKEILIGKILELRNLLNLLGVSSEEIDLNNATIIQLQQNVTFLEKLINNQLKIQTDELSKIIDSLNRLIGEVLASKIHKEWSGPRISSHLAVISSVLEQTKEKLLKTLRQELKRLEKELSLLINNGLSWYVSLQQKNTFNSSSWQKLNEQVRRFDDRVTALLNWVPIDSQLMSVTSLCDKISTTDPGPSQSLGMLVDKYREQFATVSWTPLFKYDDFSLRLKAIQAEVQDLLYRYLQTFNSELKYLNKEFKQLMPILTAPQFEIDNNDKLKSIQDCFQNLYKWAIGGFRSTIIKCRTMQKSGVHWRDCSGGSISWNELNNQIEELIDNAVSNINFQMVCTIGAKVSKLLDGLCESKEQKKEEKSISIKIYDDPFNPPNFTEIEELFNEGSILIKIEPKNVRGNVGNYRY